MESALAIVTGEGDLPRFLAQECERSKRRYVLVLFGDFLPDWAKDHPRIVAAFEKPAALFKALEKEGCRQVVFAGAMQRPKLNPLRFDWKFLKLAPTLLPALKSGDDVTLRTINQVFESENIQIVSAHELLQSLVAAEGVLGAHGPSEDDRVDIARAYKIAKAAGSVDVGQGAVVAQGLCLAVESVQGTDAMLDFVARSGDTFRPDPKGGRGVLCKAPKPGQDRRVDMPAIGPRTVELAAKAGLAGIAVQSGGVLVLGQDETIAKADELGLFLIGIPDPDENQ